MKTIIFDKPVKNCIFDKVEMEVTPYSHLVLRYPSGKEESFEFRLFFPANEDLLFSKIWEKEKELWLERWRNFPWDLVKGMLFFKALFPPDDLFYQRRFRFEALKKSDLFRGMPEGESGFWGEDKGEQLKHLTRGKVERGEKESLLSAIYSPKGLSNFSEIKEKYLVFRNRVLSKVKKIKRKSAKTFKEKGIAEEGQRRLFLKNEMKKYRERLPEEEKELFDWMRIEAYFFSLETIHLGMVHLYRKIRKKLSVPEKRAFILSYFRGYPLLGKSSSNYPFLGEIPGIRENPIIWDFWGEMGKKTEALIVLVLIYVNADLEFPRSADQFSPPYYLSFS